jgi:hypothetical protein
MMAKLGVGFPLKLLGPKNFTHPLRKVTNYVSSVKVNNFFQPSEKIPQLALNIILRER